MYLYENMLRCRNGCNKNIKNTITIVTIILVTDMIIVIIIEYHTDSITLSFIR